jgi:hypothetical protein
MNPDRTNHRHSFTYELDRITHDTHLSIHSRCVRRVGIEIGRRWWTTLPGGRDGGGSSGLVLVLALALVLGVLHHRGFMGMKRSGDATTTQHSSAYRYSFYIRGSCEYETSGFGCFVPYPGTRMGTT